MKTLLFTFLLILSGSCSRSSQEDLTTKVLNLASSPISHFDPQLVTDLSSLLVLAKSYEALMETHPYQAPYEVLPNLAVEMPTVSADGLVYTFKIRSDIFYHPCECFGTTKSRKVVAKDFETAFKRTADPHIQSPHFSYWAKQIVGLSEWYELQKANTKTDYSQPIAGVNAIDETTLKITLKMRNHYFLNDLTVSVTAPLPQEALDFYHNNLAEVMIGTGPFILKNVVHKNRIEFEKNPQFRKKFFPGDPSKRLPFIDKIVVHVMNEAQTTWLNFLKGRVDYLEIPKDNFDSSITAQASLAPELEQKGIKLGVTDSNTNLYYFGINNRHPFLKNRSLRQAMLMAFDHANFNRLFFNGTAQIAHTVLPPGIPGNEIPLQNPVLGAPISQAKKLMASAGFPEGKGLPAFTLTVRDTTLARQVGEFFQREMAKIGVQIKVDMVPFATLLERAQKGKAEIFYLAWFVGVPTGLQFFDLLYGPNWPASFNRVA
ncbi:MAG: ABC transporter substrate-binding protein, partial [Bdellovibrionota bacterium]